MKSKKQIKKRILAAVLSLLMLLTAFPLTGSVASAAEDIACGDFRYRVLEDGTAEITSYNGSDTELIVPSELNGNAVTRIGDNAFYSCSSLTSVALPNSVTFIGNSVFEYCTSLINVTLSKSTTSIGNYVFRYCSSLTNILLPDNINSFGDGIFYWCDSLTNVTLPNSLASIGNSTFSGCASLTNVTFPNSIISMGSATFSGCDSLTSITLPNNITSISEYTFSGCASLINITLPDSITSIGEHAFYHCASLIDIALPNSVTSIDEYAFSYCTSLKDIILPNSITSIGWGLFSHCESLESVMLPNSITSINQITFEYCSSLTKVGIPDSIISIENSAFSCCSSLKNIILPDSVTYIGRQTFFSCTSLTDITLSDNLTGIGSSAFSGCTALSDIKLPDSLTYIDDGAFSCCSSLTSIVIPKNVTVIGNYDFATSRVFSECTLLNNIIVEPDNPSYCDIDGVLFSKDKTKLFRYPIGKTDEQYTMPSDTIHIGSAAFEGCRFLKTVVLPDKMDFINAHSFYQCTSLAEVIIPNSITYIELSAFEGCTSLTHITLPNNITSIAPYAFKNCTALTNITIPKSVNWVASMAFKDCISLAEIKISNDMMELVHDAFDNTAYYNNEDNWDNGVLYIGNHLVEAKNLVGEYAIKPATTAIANGAFYYNSIESIKIPNSVIIISSNAFSDCSSLRSITIPDGVTTIAPRTFDNCRSLTNIVLPNSVKSIGNAAFDDCEALSDVYYTGSEKEWNSIEIDYGDAWDNNNAFLNANIHFNCASQLLQSGHLGKNTVAVTAFNKAPLMEGHTNLISSSSDKLNVKLNQVNLTADGLQETFDQTILLSSAYKNKFTTFSRKDFRDYYIPASVTTSWFVNGTAEAKNIYMEQDKKDGRPYVSTVFGHETGTSGGYVELQSEKMTAMSDTKYDLIVTANLAGAAGATYWLSQDDARKISNKDGFFSAQVLSKTFVPNQPVYAYVETDTGAMSEPVQLNLSITELSLPTDTFSLLGKDGIKIKFDKDKPLIGGAEISLDGFKFPLGVEVEGNRFKISFGFDAFSMKSSGGAMKKDTWESFKKSVFGLNASVSSATDKLKEYKKFYETFAPGDPYNIKSKNFDVRCLGYAEGNIINGNMVFTDFCGEIASKFSFKYTEQGSIWIIPVYGYVGAGAELAAKLNSVRALPDKEVPFDFGFTLKLKPELDLGLGVGVKGAVSGGLYGSGALPIENDFTKKHTLVQLSGEIGIEGEFFCFNGKKSLLDGNITLWDKYYGKATPKMLTQKFGELPVQENPTVTSVMPRDYLKETSGWLDRNLFRRMFRSRSVKKGVETRELQTSVFKNSQTQLISLDDGRMMMAWIEDNSKRDTYNRMQLVYSIWANGTWSKPKAVDDDGTNDGYPALSTDGKNVFIAWQNVKRKLTEQDADSIDAILQNSEIDIAEFDWNKDEFVNRKTLTNNETYDYMPTLAVQDGNAVLYWLNNKENDLTLAGSNTICRYSSEKQAAEEVYYDVNYILSMDCGFIDGKDQLSYSMDQDGDTATTNDMKVFSLTNGIQTQQTPADSTEETADFSVVYGSLEGKNTLFFANNNNIFYRQNDEIKTVFDDYRSINGELQVLQNGDETTLMWSETSVSGTELWICTYSNGVWSDPIQISKSDSHFHDMSAVFHNGSVHAVFDRTERVLDGETYVNGQTDLCYLTLSDYTDLEAEFAVIDESQFVMGESSKIPVYLKNNGTKDIDKVALTLTDGVGTEIKVEEEVNLLSGSDCIIEVEYPVPMQYTRTALEVKANAVNGEDINISNNQDKKEIGYVDLSIGEITTEDVGKYFILTAILSNDNQATANDVAVQVHAGSKDGEQLASIKVGTMAPNEKRTVQYIVNKEAISYDEEKTEQLYFVASLPEPEAASTKAKTEATELITEDNFSGAVVEYLDAKPSATPGDVNMDDKVTATDARWTLQAATGNRELNETQQKAADLNGDGKISSIDARWILQRATGNRDAS